MAWHVHMCMVLILLYETLFSFFYYDVVPGMILLYAFLADLFRCEDVVRLNLTGLDHVITITAVEGKIYLRNYQ